jgi:GMP reductase
VYHRLGGIQDIYSFTQKINEENWHLKSISVGVDRKDFEMLKNIKRDGLELDWITIDVALIYNEHFADRIKEIRQLFPEVYLIAGNFNAPETVQWLNNLGVDCGKFGIGCSNLCRTRQYTGFGTSSISDLYECSKISNIDIIADGGLSIIDEEKGEIALGDIFKALNFGAKWVMSSSLFRWVKELGDCQGIIEQYGNSTARAKGYNRNVEGACKTYISNGQTLEERMDQITQNIQSSISYAGIKTIKHAYQSVDYEIIT